MALRGQCSDDKWSPRRNEHACQRTSDIAESEERKAHVATLSLSRNAHPRGPAEVFGGAPFRRPYRTSITRGDSGSGYRRSGELVQLSRLFHRNAPPRVDRLVVGLGNPGDGYANTRHNVGFQVANRLAKRARLEFDTKAAESRIAEGSLGDLRIAIARPQTFMNAAESGGEAARSVRLAPDALLVIFDEIDLPLGKLRLRQSGGPGTHHGMKRSPARSARAFAARIGCAERSASEIGDLAEYVLSAFTAEERAEADKMIVRGAEAAEVAVRDGIKRAMDTFNG